MKPNPNRPVRWIRAGLLTAATLLLLAMALVGTGLALEQRRLVRVVEVPERPLTVPQGASALARGQYLYASRGCADCHGDAGQGRRFVDQAGVRLAGPDLTSGGVTTRYAPGDWVRAVRHGVAPGGRPLRVMPAEDYNRLTDADLGALVAYVQSLPAAGGARAELQLPLPARVLYGLGLADDAADRIDHTRPPAAPVPETVNPAHGRYVAQSCVGCHGPDLLGRRIPGAPPDWPAAPRLAPGSGSVMAAYGRYEDFESMMKGGVNPAGRALAVMPFESLARLNDTDLRALHLYLTGPAAAGSGR